MVLRLSVVILYLFTISACAIQRTDLSVIREGATRARVESVLGKPIKSVETAEGRIDTYEYNTGYEPKPARSGDFKPTGLWLLPIVLPIAHSIRYEKQRAEIDIVYGSDDRVVGRRREVERREAIDRFKEKADRGDPDAQTRYAIFYATGQERIDYLCRAARQGDAEAQYYIGRGRMEDNYLTDAQLPRDPVRAYMWLKVAGSNGHYYSTQVRKQFSSQLTPAQIAEGERLAAEWTPDSPCP